MGNRATTQDVDAFIALFDGNVDDAAHALLSAQKRTQKRRAGTPEGKLLLRAKDVTKTYTVNHRKVHALKGISFDIYEGEFVAVTAPSGSGKSTLLQIMSGLERPTEGSIEVGGINLNDLSDQKLSEFRGQSIGFIFQFFYLQPFLNVEQNIQVPGMFARSPMDERHERVAELARAVGIADRLKHLPRELSGGQIQRAAIARALLNRPKLVLADEPTGNLDSKNGSAIIELFDKIRAEMRTTIVVATHDLAVASRADRVISLEDGLLV